MSSELFDLISHNLYHDKNDKEIMEFMKKKAKTSHYQYVNSEGLNAFYMAVKAKKAPIVRHMLSSYKKYNLLFDANVQDSEGNTAFMLSFKDKNNVVASNLMDFYVKNPTLISVNTINHYGENFLHFLLDSGFQEGYGYVFNEVNQKHQLYHFDFSQVNYQNITPSMLLLNYVEKCIQDNNASGLVQFLTPILSTDNHNIDFHCVDKNGNNLLLLLCSYSKREEYSIELIELFMEHKEKFNLAQTNYVGKNALAKVNHQYNTLIADKLLSYEEFSHPTFFKQALESMDEAQKNMAKGLMKIYIEKFRLEESFSFENQNNDLTQNKKLKI